MKVADYKELINLLPEQQHSFTIKKSNWEKYFSEPYGSLILSQFTSSEIEISRNDIFHTNSLDDMIIKTILWGYPSGMRGSYFSQIMSNLPELKAFLKNARQGIADWKQHNIQIPGLGLSTYSKLLFFIKAEIEGYPAVILDQRIIDTINKKCFDDLLLPKKISYQNGLKNYPAYLKMINQIAIDNNLPHGKVEMFLFEYGQNLKEITS